MAEQPPTPQQTRRSGRGCALWGALLLGLGAAVPTCLFFVSLGALADGMSGDRRTVAQLWSEALAVALVAGAVGAVLGGGGGLALRAVLGAETAGRLGRLVPWLLVLLVLVLLVLAVLLGLAGLA
jgi:hypothetical protein